MMFKQDNSNITKLSPEWQQQETGATMKPSVPPRKRVYNPPALVKDNRISTTLGVSSTNKKRRVVVPSSTSNSAGAGSGWWKFGKIQKDTMKGLVKSDAPTTNAGTSNPLSDRQEETDPTSILPTYPSSALNTQTQGLQALATPNPACNSGENTLQTSQMIMRAGQMGLASFNPQLNMMGVAPTGFSGALGNPSMFVPNVINMMAPHNPSADEGITEDESDDGSSSADSTNSALKFRAYQAESWTEKFEELIEFRHHYGHCFVPNAFAENAALAQWVKRQRYQYKLKKEGKRSTLSDERVDALEEIDFVWDSHSAVWNERLNELVMYKKAKGDCNVPSRYAENRQLAVWVKRQRRQYKFYGEGKPSSMTKQRIVRLEEIGFQWDLRSKS